MTMANKDNHTVANGQDAIEGLNVSLKLSQDLLALLGEENLALRSMSTQELFRISRQKTMLLAKLGYVDATLKNILPAEGQNSGEASERGQVIGQYKRRINEVRGEIMANNMINKRLTEDTLGYLNDAISLLTRPSREEALYRAPGKVPARNITLPSVISRAV